MGVSTFPSGGGGSPIKSIQRGVASSSGNITISEVDTSKTMVRSFSVGSSGTVAATGAVGSMPISANVAAGTISGNIAAVTGTLSRGSGTPTAFGISAIPLTIPAHSFSGNNAAAAIPGNIGPANITGGTTDLTVSEFGIYIVNSTTIFATGACRWEVIEFN